MTISASLKTRLEAAIPLGVEINVLHVSTPPTPTSAIFTAAPGQPNDTTLCESHFLAITNPLSDSDKETSIFAIEVLIFTTIDLTNVFISKADSTGFSAKLNTPKGTPSIISTITATFLDFLIQPRLSESRVVLSLFARAQNQYLFPGSIENNTKHVLDDRQLIKWWCRIVDKVLRLHDTRATSETLSFSESHAYVVVPGCDAAETKAFFPASSRHDPSGNPEWSNSYPAQFMVSNPDLPPRCLIPRLPDDPKARFLDDLDGDHVDDQGCWRSIKTLPQFWEMMSYRQECSAGRLVGFIWVTFSNQFNDTREDEGENKVKLGDATKIFQSAAIIAESTDRAESPPERQNGYADEAREVTRLLSALPETQDASLNGILVSQSGDDLASISTAEPAKDIFYDHTRCRPARWPASTVAPVVMSAHKYQQLMEFLLQLDFAGDGIAAASTKDWISKAEELSARPGFKISIKGRMPPKAAEPLTIAPPPQVNVLTGVRKKRKADQGTSLSTSPPSTIIQSPDDLAGRTNAVKKTKLE